MTRALVLATAIVAAGCAGRPVLLQGDAKSAVVGYSGDLAATAAVAERHCERYQRTATLTNHDLDTAYFACVRP